MEHFVSTELRGSSRVKELFTQVIAGNNADCLPNQYLIKQLVNTYYVYITWHGIMSFAGLYIYTENTANGCWLRGTISKLILSIVRSESL